MKNVILIGMMGCGKSTVGAILARRLGMELNDTDAMVEALHPDHLRGRGGGVLPGL